MNYELHPPEDIDPSVAYPNLCQSDIQDFEIEERMLFSGPTVIGTENTSFTEYMRQFDAARPDVLLFTVRSAIPLADAVRGWKQEQGVIVPELDTILANRLLSQVDNDDTRHVIEQETRRLAERHSGQRAVVFDQYVHSGATLRLAKRIMQDAGMIIVGSTPQAQWYNDLVGGTRVVDYERLTTIYHDFMMAIGRRAVDPLRYWYDDFDDAGA